MRKKISVLIIDDHPIIIEAYKLALKNIQNNNDINFNIYTAVDCKSGYQAIINFSKNKNIDLIILDISLPDYKNLKLYSGEDLGLIIRKLLPESKIIISTTYNDNFRLYTLLKNLSPEGLLIKGDIVPKNLENAILTVIQDQPYFSKTINKLLLREVVNDLVLDAKDRQLIYELSLGTKTKDLANILHLSLAGIERRKRRLKFLFDIENKEDRELILKAKEKGFI